MVLATGHITVQIDEGVGRDPLDLTSLVQRDRTVFSKLLQLLRGEGGEDVFGVCNVGG